MARIPWTLQTVYEAPLKLGDSVDVVDVPAMGGDSLMLEDAALKPSIQEITCSFFT